METVELRLTTAIARVGANHSVILTSAFANKIAAIVRVGAVYAVYLDSQTMRV